MPLVQNTPDTSTSTPVQNTPDISTSTSVQNTPDTSISTPVHNTQDTTTSTPTGTSQKGQTKVKFVVSSQGQTKGKTTAPTSQKTRTAAKKSTGYHRAPPPLRTDLLKGLRWIDVRRTLDQIKLEVAEFDALPTRLTQEQHDLRTLRLQQSWILGDHLKGVRIDMSDEDAMEFIQSLPYLPPDLEGATGSSTTTSTTDASTSQGVDLVVDQDSSDSDMEVNYRSRESRTRRTKSGPRSCEFADCPGYSVRDARHFAANHLPWFVIPQTACWEWGSNRVQVKQLHKHLLHQHNLRIDNLDAYTHRSIPFFITQMEALLMSIATDLNLSCLQDLVDYLQRQDLRPRHYNLSLHFHNAVTEFCDRNQLTQPETIELHPPTHVSGLLHHSSVVYLLSQLPSYRQKEYLHFLVGNVDEAMPTQKKVHYADLAAIGNASQKSSTSSVSSASSRPRSASCPRNQRILSAQRSVKLVQTNHGLWPDGASTDNFSCSSQDYVTDAHFHPCMIVEQIHLKHPPTWSRIASKANVAPDFPSPS